MGVLNAPGPFGLLVGQVTTAAVRVLPLSLILTYLVPLSIILHLIALRQVLGPTEELALG